MCYFLKGQLRDFWVLQNRICYSLDWAWGWGPCFWGWGRCRDSCSQLGRFGWFPVLAIWLSSRAPCICRVIWVHHRRSWGWREWRLPDACTRLASRSCRRWLAFLPCPPIPRTWAALGESYLFDVWGLALERLLYLAAEELGGGHA